MNKFREWRWAERGASSAALVILSLPLIIGVFGFGFDTLRLNYIQRYAQGRVDLATQAAAATTYTDTNGAIRLGSPSDPYEWETVAYDSYARNTSDKRGSGNTASMFQCSTESVTGGSSSGDCAGVASVVGTEPPVGFDFCNTISSGDVYGVRYDVVETVPTVFLRIIGIQDFTFSVSSETLIRQRNC